MGKYSIFINGTNLFLEIDGEICRYGFYTTRYVEASSDKKASVKAIDLIKCELEDISLNDLTDPPILEIEDIQPLESFGDIQPPGAGFSLYKEKYH